MSAHKTCHANTNDTSEEDGTLKTFIVLHIRIIAQTFQSGPNQNEALKPEGPEKANNDMTFRHTA